MGAALQIVQSPHKAAVLLQAGRLDLLQALEQPATAAGLARKLNVPRQKLNYHLHELEREGFLELVEERRKGNVMERVLRATARSYLIAPQVTAQREESAAVRDRFSVAYLITAAARLIRELSGIALRARATQKRVATLTLEADIRFASAESRHAFAEDLATTIATLTAKYHDEHAAGGRRFRILAAAYPAGQTAGQSAGHAPQPSSDSINLE